MRNDFTLGQTSLRAIRLLVVASLVLGMFVTPWMATRAYACSCAGNLPAAYFAEQADVVLVGTAGVRSVGSETYGERLTTDGRRNVYPSRLSSQPLHVETYLKGTGNAVITVYGDASSTCSFAGEAQKRYLLFLVAQGGKLETGLCNGNTALDTPVGQARLQEVRAVTGLGRLPEDTVAQSRWGIRVAGVALVGLAGVAAWVRGWRRTGGS